VDVDLGGLYYKVLMAKYGMEGGRVREWSSLSSIWWKDLCDIVKGGGGVAACWFLDGVGHWADNGEDTLFWCDAWLDSGVLRSRFNFQARHLS